MSSSPSIATTGWACGISARTRRPRARSWSFRSIPCGCNGKKAPAATDVTSEPDEQGLSVGRGRPVAPDDRGVVIAKYPEWDHVHGIERPEWTVVREVPVRIGDPRMITEALDRADVLRSRIGRLVRGVRIGRTIRLNRQHEGHDHRTSMP